MEIQGLTNEQSQFSSGVPSKEAKEAQSSFVPPRHWIGPEELKSDYWNDPKIKVRRAQEFHDKPVETIDLIDRLDNKGIARRDFLTIMGASMAMASFACARRPVHKIIPYVIKPEEITLGLPNYYASTDPETGYGLLVKTREGRPIKLEGNPDHPLNRGKLHARGQAAVLDLYDPDRLKEPLTRQHGGGAPRNISWAEADTAIQSRLRGRVRVLSGRVLGESTRKLIQEFLTPFNSGAGGHVEFDPLGLEEISDAQAESYGTPLVPHYHFDRADVILSLGADFLGTWPLSVAHSADWVKNRKLNGRDPHTAKLSKMICFEPIMSVTGANADERYPIRPGDELKIALALAHELFVVQKKGRFAGDTQVAALLAPYRPEAVAQEVGIQSGAEVLRKIATELWAARGKGLIVGGGIESKGENALGLQVVINLLNSALENEGATVDGTVSPNLRPVGGFAALSKLMSEMRSGAVDVLIVYRSNPAYSLPAALDFSGALKRVPLVIAITDRDDETAQFADYVLPDHHFLENWGDAHPRKDLYSLQQPTIQPIHSTRAFQDTLLTWIKGAGLKVTGLAMRVANGPADSNTWHDYLVSNWRDSIYRDYGISGSFELFWEGVLRAGVFNGLEARGQSALRPTARTFRPGSLARVTPPKPMTDAGPYLSLYAKMSIYDGNHANNAWLQEMPDPISSVTWDNYLNVGPALAQKLALEKHDLVEVTSEGVTLRLPVNIQPGMHPQAVSMAVGYGRTAAGKVGNLNGVNVSAMIRTDESGTKLLFSGRPVKIRKTGQFYQLASTQWHMATENRPIISDVSLAQFKANPSSASHTDPHLRPEEAPLIWPKHSYPGMRWGMAIDLNSCTGCGACVLGCQAENNIPVVGRDNVRVSRQMHWIRIDRYYSGTPEQPDVVFQPMLCQHCENAPCETVCPVLATVHNDEGMNEQVYNRCVGTRYCQNNCPYKVRRFNFFDHWKSYEGTMNLVWNPEVTVRTRGIMEKCSFCVQRVRDAKDKAKDNGVKVRDGEIVTACQQTCPTDAIVFGNINDPESRVSKLKTDPRAFRVLEVLNTVPSISYMTKVRNKEGAGHSGSEHHV